MMKLVVLVPLLPYLLEYNNPLFRALSYDVQCMVQYGKTYTCLNSCMRIYGTYAVRGSRAFLPRHSPSGVARTSRLGGKVSEVQPQSSWQCYFSSENHFYFSFYLVQYQSF